MAALRPIPLTCAQFRATRLSYSAGAERHARVSLYRVETDDTLSTTHIEAVAEFDSYVHARRAIKAADATIAAFWASRRERA